MSEKGIRPSHEPHQRHKIRRREPLNASEKKMEKNKHPEAPENGDVRSDRVRDEAQNFTYTGDRKRIKHCNAIHSQTHEI